MNLSRYTIQSFLHFFRLNLTVILGVALSMAILLGAFVIGDSVKYSLQQITLNRLGQTEYVITAGERLFRAELANDLNRENLKATSVLRANGMAILNGGEARANQLQVWGVNHHFNSFAVTDSLYQLKPNEAVINEHLANVLGVKKGQELLIRINKLSTFPSNTPFVSAEENSISFRVTVKAIATINQTGNFNLQNIQSSPKNIFLSKEWLNKQLELDNKANVILIGSKELDETELLQKLANNWQLEDINLKIRQNEKLGFTEIISDRVFIEPEIEASAKNHLNSCYTVLTYFVNQFQKDSNSTPYSFVTGLPANAVDLKDEEVIINRWLADDLNAKVGDSVRLSYFVVGPLRQLDEKDDWLKIKTIVNMEGKWADQLLMPTIPGMSDAGHCRDWKTGVPVDLASIRQKDEDYWNKYKGTPKAFISLQTAKKLWTNRFGAATALRINTLDAKYIEQSLLSELSPASVGFQLKAVKDEGLQAASGGVDFGELFIGLSFFVLFAALLLAYLMFRLYLNFRRSEVATLQALGFPSRKIRSIFLSESVLIILIGVVIGIPIGLAYNSIILKAISTIWYDIVQTSILHVQVTSNAILKAFFVVSFISMITVSLILLKYIRTSSKKLREETTNKRRNGWISLFIGLFLLIGSIALLASLFLKQNEIDPNIFFASGFGLLPAFILLLNSLLILSHTKSKTFKTSTGFIIQRIQHNSKKNILVVSFLSIGIFMVLSTGLNRKDLTSKADQPSSGTGGYDFFAETSLPVLQDLNSNEGRFEFGLEETAFRFVQLRALTGDDASCLNLNKISRPRILGFDPQPFDQLQAFSFITQTDELNTEHPWLTLNQELPGGLIPAIADQTVIKWGLGKSVGDTLVYKNELGKEVSLKLIGGLANSIFQGNVLIAEKYFLKHFPSVSGSQVFLGNADSDRIEQLQTSLRNYGGEVTLAKDRLLKFYQIENTYLNIYLQLGALGLLIGTIGLGVIIFRNLMEKRSEFAVMQALGIHMNKLFKIVLVEHLLVVLASIIIGALPAIISALPSLRSNLYGGLIYWTISIAILVFISAASWIFIAGKLAMRAPLNKALRND